MALRISVFEKEQKMINHFEKVQEKKSVRKKKRENTKTQNQHIDE